MKYSRLRERGYERVEAEAWRLRCDAMRCDATEMLVLNASRGR
jgi:hypothetical protein